jgi:hypothetical protein
MIEICSLNSSNRLKIVIDSDSSPKLSNVTQPPDKLQPSSLQQSGRNSCFCGCFEAIFMAFGGLPRTKPPKASD